MIATASMLDSLGGRLLESLQVQLQLLAVRRGQMDQLLTAVARQDNAAMEAWLTQAQALQIRQEQADCDLEERLRAVAEALDIPGEAPRLSVLAAELGGEISRAILVQRKAIVSALVSLRRRHAEASLLLHQCRKFNHLLMDALLREGAPCATYGADGQVRRRQGGSIRREL